MNVINATYRFFYGYDFFISYSRADGSFYSLELARLLSDRGYTCFLDQWGSEPNKELPRSLLRILEESKILIILSTNHSRASVHVKQEVETFAKTGKNIIPINAPASEIAPIWASSIEGLAASLVTDEEINKGIVAESIINRLSNSFSYRKQKLRIKRIATVLVGLFILIPIAFLITYLTYTSQIKVKNEELLKLNKESRLLDSSNTLMRKQNDSISRLNKDIQDSIAMKSKILGSTLNTLKQTNKNLETSDIDGKQLYTKASDIVKKIYSIYQSENSYYKNYTQQEHNSVFSENKPIIVVFEYDRSTLKSSSTILLNKVITFCKDNPGIQLNILGYASAFGLGIAPDDSIMKKDYRWGKFDFDIKPSEYLKQLTQLRANSVKGYIISRGIPSSTIKTISYGETRPENTLGYFNDRVEIYLKK